MIYKSDQMPITTVSDRATVRKILAIRRKAGNPGTTCPTCARPADAGYRTCVDPCHVPSETLAIGSRRTWLDRPEARAWRKQLLADLTAR